jgi:hypothetical protein
MALWEKPRFQRDHWKEMLMHIRRATEGTGCAANVHWLHTWSTLTDTTVNYELLVTKCLDELTSLEARLGRQCLKKTADSLPQQTQGSAQRGGQRQDGQEGRQSRPQLQLVRRRTGTGRPNRSWKTSPASGGHDLKGPAPPDAPPGCNTLMDACWHRTGASGAWSRDTRNGNAHSGSHLGRKTEWGPRRGESAGPR